METMTVLGETLKQGDYITLSENSPWDVFERDLVCGHVDDETAREAVYSVRGWPKPRQAFVTKHRWAHFIEDRIGGPMDAWVAVTRYSGLGAIPVTVVEELPF